MTTYYVSPSGNNSNNGLGPDASHGTNKPWLTLAKALGAAGIASGDTVYIAPGTYREAVAVAMTSATGNTNVLGDPGNAQGFKDGSGVLLAAGDVIWSAYTTNDTTTPSTSPTLDLAGRDFLTFQYILFVGGNTAASGSVVRGTTTHSINIVFRDCAFVGSAAQILMNYVGVTDIAANWTIDRCIFIAPYPTTCLDLAPVTSAGADYDLNFLVQNSIFYGGSAQNGINITPSGAGSFKPGGVDILNCTIMTGANGVRTTTANMSTSIPCTVNNSLILNCATGLNAGASGQITEDYCRIIAATPRNNVSAGANSISTAAHAFLVELGQALLFGRTSRPFLAPMAGSPLLGFGSTGAPSVDLQNITRPAGGASLNNAVGAQERHNTAAQETTTVHGGSSGLVLTGPGDQSFQVAVSAASTTIAVYARYDSTHAATNKPQMTVTNGGECGVNDATATMIAAADTWEQVSLTFTPTRAGIVTVRFVSRAAAGGGKAFFDDFSVT
jgi:hypothetical protein